MATEEDVVGKLKNLFESTDRNFMDEPKPEINENGAEEAAEKILSIIQNLN